jgi:hypothetical protein
LIPETVARADGRGRLEVHGNRAVMNGILWVLRTGAAWADLPDRFPSGSTCFRRFSRWVKTGVLRQRLEALARHLEEVGQLDLSECFIDGTFVLAKKGTPKWERPNGASVYLPVGIDVLNTIPASFTWLSPSSSCVGIYEMSSINRCKCCNHVGQQKRCCASNH